MNKKEKLTPYLAIGRAEGFEEATSEQQMEAWAYIIKHGLWKGLQGFFGRTCESLIQQGLISKKGKIDWERYNDVLSAR